MRVTVNGEIREVPEGQTVQGLLDEAGFQDGRGVAVAVGGEVVPRSDWESTPLKEDQKIEILRAIQGG
jgi:sulfur carrier protein